MAGEFIEMEFNVQISLGKLWRVPQGFTHIHAQASQAEHLLQLRT